MKNCLSQFKKTCMILMEHPSKIGEGLPDNANKSTWKFLHSYIDAHSQRLIDEYSGGGSQAITIF